MRWKIWTVLILLGLNSACNLCGNTQVSRLGSPDGQLEAVIFERSCGATTGFTTQISIVRKASSLPSGAGNTFIADSNHGAAARASWGGPPADVKWLANRSLMISIHPATRISVQHTAVSIRTGILSRERVAVQYAAIP